MRLPQLSTAFAPNMIMTGLVAVLIGYSSSIAIILQALAMAGLSTEQTGGWLMMLGIGMGVTTIGFSLYYKNPILTAWSTPGIALLTTSLVDTSINEVVGVFIFSAILTLICGVTGIFARLMNHIPRSIAAAMLAGILLRFGLSAFESLQLNFTLGILMLVTYIVVRRLFPLYAIIATMCVGILMVGLNGELHFSEVNNVFSLPTYVTPTFTWTSLISVGIPFFVVSLASQYAPGIAILQANGYPSRTSILLIGTSLMTIILAPWGGFSICVAAITAAICMAPDISPDRSKRYIAAIWAGVFYLVAGLFGGAIFILFNGLPPALIVILAGLALLTPLMNSLHQALVDENGRDAAIICFLLTASGIVVFSIGSAFWGLIGGIIAHRVLAKKTKI